MYNTTSSHSTHTGISHEADVDVASDLHAFGVSIDSADEEKKKRLLHVLVTVNLGRDGTGQFVVEVVLRHLTERNKL